MTIAPVKVKTSPFLDYPVFLGGDLVSVCCSEWLTYASCRYRLAPHKAGTVDADGRSLMPDGVIARLQRRRVNEDVAETAAWRVRSQLAAPSRVVVIDDVDVGRRWSWRRQVSGVEVRTAGTRTCHAYTQPRRDVMTKYVSAPHNTPPLDRTP